MEIVSKYKDNVVAKKSRVFFSAALDYGLVFITSLLLFYLSLLGASKLPIYTANVNKFDEYSLKARKYINTTHLRHYDNETGEVRSQEVDENNYVITLVKTSAYVFNLPYPVEKEDSTYDMEALVKEEETFIHNADQYPLDNISYFWFSFYPNSEDFNNKQTDVTVDKLYLEKMKYNSKEGFVNNFVTNDTAEYVPYKDQIPVYLVLTKKNTEGLINKLVFNDKNVSEDIKILYTDLKLAYGNGVQSGINEVEKNSKVYLDIMDNINDSYNAIRLIIFIAYVIAYVVGYLVLVFLGRGMAERFITVSQKAMNLALARKDESEPRALNIVIYHIINAFIYFSSIIIGFFFTGYFGVLGLPLVGPFNLLSIVLVSLLFLVVSVVTIAVTKNNQTFGLLVSNMVIKDTREFETNLLPGEKESLENNADGK